MWRDFSVTPQGGVTSKESLMNAEEYSERGDKYFSEKNYDGAMADFTELIKLEPDNPFAYYKRGLSYTNKKEFDHAITDFTEAIRLEPNKFGDFYFDRGGAYVLKGDKTLAIADLEMAIKIDPQNENYQKALKEIKSGKTPKTANVSSPDAELKKHIIFMIVGGVIGGVIGFTVGEFVGLFIGLFVGIGLRPFLQGLKEYLIDGLYSWGGTIRDSIAEDGIFVGFFKGLFIGFFLLMLFGFFILGWKIIKGPFVAIYQLVTGDYEFYY
jgi:tetratricopeptide (TPR) repeat protein